MCVCGSCLKASIVLVTIQFVSLWDMLPNRSAFLTRNFEQCWQGRAFPMPASVYLRLRMSRFALLSRAQSLELWARSVLRRRRIAPTSACVSSPLNAYETSVFPRMIMHKWRYMLRPLPLAFELESQCDFCFKFDANCFWHLKLVQDLKNCGTLRLHL